VTAHVGQWRHRFAVFSGSIAKTGCTVCFITRLPIYCLFYMDSAATPV